MKVSVTQSGLTLCDPMNCGLLSSSVHGLLQARTLDWVAIPFSRDLSDPGTEPGPPASQADSLPSEPPGKPKNTGVGSLFPSPGELPDPGFEMGSPVLQSDSLLSELLPKQVEIITASSGGVGS